MKPRRNNCFECFNGKLSDECLYDTSFGTLGNARKNEKELQEDYNWQNDISIMKPYTDRILEEQFDGQNGSPTPKI